MIIYKYVYECVSTYKHTSVGWAEKQEAGHARIIKQNSGIIKQNELKSRFRFLSSSLTTLRDFVVVVLRVLVFILFNETIVDGMCVNACRCMCISVVFTKI